ncbi:MAG TPA: hypothetical protein VJH20_01170 [Candidatus Nanoarchaeia archaeon]|nr:hypothetical protein [Candidatus Nanoarchaeia archaeon]
MSKDDNTGLWSEAEEGRQLAISDPSVVSGSYTADKNIFYAVNTFLTRDLHGHLINAEDMPHNSRFIYHIGDCTTILAYESYNKSLLSRSEELELHVVGRQPAGNKLFGVLERKIQEVGGKPIARLPGV